jgi:hypothetical protein
MEVAHDIRSRAVCFLQAEARMYRAQLGAEQVCRCPDKFFIHNSYDWLRAGERDALVAQLVLKVAGGVFKPARGIAVLAAPTIDSDC